MTQQLKSAKGKVAQSAELHQLARSHARVAAVYDRARVEHSRAVRLALLVDPSASSAAGHPEKPRRTSGRVH